MYIRKYLKQFSTENYKWKLAIGQKCSCLLFETFCPKIYTRKYLKQFSTENYTWKLYIVQNVLIPFILLISLDQNVSILLVNNIYIENIRVFWHRKLYIKNWYSSKSLWIQIFFLFWFFVPKYCTTPKSENIPGSKMP